MITDQISANNATGKTKTNEKNNESMTVPQKNAGWTKLKWEGLNPIWRGLTQKWKEGN